MLPHRSRPTLMTVPSETRIGLAPHVGPTLPWKNMTEGSQHPVDTVPGIITGSDRPFPCDGIIMTERAMDAVLLLRHGLGWKTTRHRVVPTMTLMMPGLRLPLRVTTRTHISRHGPMAVPVHLPEVTTLVMIALATGR